ncbi:hypothetical protein Hanom_Chr03g00245341 [Helianthus anomalus]
MVRQWMVLAQPKGGFDMRLDMIMIIGLQSEECRFWKRILSCLRCNNFFTKTRVTPMDSI